MFLTCVYDLKTFDHCFLMVCDCFSKFTDDIKVKGLREGNLFRDLDRLERWVPKTCCYSAWRREGYKQTLKQPFNT